MTKACPKDQDAKKRFLDCKKIVQRIAFENAIRVDEVKKSVADALDLDSMSIDDDYDGPCLNDDGITVQFMEELIDKLSKGGKLHRKYAYKILLQAKTIFENCPTLVDIEVPDVSTRTVKDHRLPSSEGPAQRIGMLM